jgi:hypothetical protein
VEPEETSIARQRLDKEVSAATDTRVTIKELLGIIFSVRSVQSGGGVEYFHRSPASRRRCRKGKSRIWGSKV